LNRRHIPDQKKLSQFNLILVFIPAYIKAVVVLGEAEILSFGSDSGSAEPQIRIAAPAQAPDSLIRPLKNCIFELK
jgi:hypothetical protein